MSTILDQASSTLGGTQIVQMPVTTLEWAVFYASRGIYVTPVIAPYVEEGKHKGGKEAFLDFTQTGKGSFTDPQNILKYWGPESGSDYNLGVLTGRASGIVIVDVDDQAGVDIIKEWIGEGIDFETNKTVSGSGARPGGHIWFKYPSWLPPEKKIPSRTLITVYDDSGDKKLGGIDIKADGGMIVVPPSKHRNGVNRYSFFHTATELPELPEKLLAKLLVRKLSGGYSGKPIPTEEQVNTLLGEDVKKPKWYRDAEKILTDLEDGEGQNVHRMIFQMGPVPSQGERWPTFQKLVGSACYWFYQVKGMSPEHVYALFSQSIDQMLAVSGNDQDWRSTIWNMICTFWDKEYEKVAKKDLDQLEKDIPRLRNWPTHWETILAGARQWGDKEALLNGTAEEWIRRRMIAYERDNYYVLTLNGLYCPYPVKEKQIISKCFETGVVPGLHSLTKPGRSGEGEILLSSTEVINKHTISIEQTLKVVGTSDFREAYFDGKTFMVPMYYRRDDLEPEFNSDCDEWLQNLFGKHNYEEGIRWIANALAFEEGAICALSLVGPPNAGKSLLACGLAETINTQKYASGEDLVSKFNDSFASTGWVVVSEGIPVPRGYGFSSVPDAFKKYISGEPLPIEPKFMSKQMVKNPIRLIMVANNYRILGTLTGGKDLTPDDKDALAQRIMHFDIPPEARDWMCSKGNYALTAGWVSRAAGGKSKYTLAKHFLWLYHNKRGDHKDGRFLVEGNLNVDDLASKHIVLQTSNALNVMLTLIKIIEGRASGLGDGVIYDTKLKQIWASCGTIVDSFNQEISRNSKVTLGIRETGAVLRSLSSEFTTRKFNKSVKWFNIRCDLLLREAVENGWPTAKLEPFADEKLLKQLGIDHNKEE